MSKWCVPVRYYEFNFPASKVFISDNMYAG